MHCNDVALNRFTKRIVHPNGSKYFQLRTTLHSKAKLIQLGAYPALSLSEAREQSREKRKQVKVDHIDPILEAKIVKQQKAKEADNTFQKIAEDWLAIKQRTLAPSTHLKIKQTFNANVYSVIGKYPIKDIYNQLVRKCLLIKFQAYNLLLITALNARFSFWRNRNSHC
jgi:hypothetical protein